MNTNDLFPETLLVRFDHGQPMTDSLTVARFFGKQHTHVLRAIYGYVDHLKDGLNRSTSGAIEAAFNQSTFGLIDSARLSNFRPSAYLDDKGRQQTMYLLTKDGFYFVAHKFTGAKAEEWQWRFIEAFNALEAELRSVTEKYAHALDQVRPCLRPVVEGTEQGLNRVAIASRLGKSANAITYHRRKAREFGLLRSRA